MDPGDRRNIPEAGGAMRGEVELTRDEPGTDHEVGEHYVTLKKVVMTRGGRYEASRIGVMKIYGDISRTMWNLCRMVDMIGDDYSKSMSRSLEIGYLSSILIVGNGILSRKDYL